jgi:hypothetical protein
MSFLGSFQKSYKEENKKIQDRMLKSDYKTQEQLKYEHYEERFDSLSQKGDGELMKKFRSLSDSSEDKNIIEDVLIQRGYTYVNDNFRKI